MSTMKRRWSWIVIGILVALTLPTFMPSAKVLFVLTTTFLFIAAAYGLFIIYAYIGQLFLCQAALMGVGAYTGTILILDYGWSFWLALLPATFLSTLIGCIVAVLLVRSHGHYFIIGSFVLGELLLLLMKRLEGLTRGSYGIAIGQYPEGFGPVQFNSVTSMYYLALAVLLLTMLMVLLIRRSNLFWKFNSIRENEPLARSLGISPRREKVIAAAFSSLPTAFAGMAYAFNQTFIDPSVFATWISVKLIFAVIIGAVLIGHHNIGGPALGGIIVLFIPEVMGLPPIINNLVYGGMIVIVVLCSVTGVFEKLRGYAGSARRTVSTE